MTTAKISELAAGTAALTALLEIESAGGVSGQVAASAMLELGNHWGEPIASWAYSSGVAVVDFTGLSAYRELRIIGYGLQHGDAATQTPLLRTSTDNGSSYAATTYTTYGQNATIGMGMAAAIPSATSFGFRWHLYDFNVAGRYTRGEGLAGQSLSATNKAANFASRDANEVNNALRFTLAAGVNLTAGNILLFGRKG